MSKKDKAVLGGKTKLIVLIKNWFHQGFFYLDKTEMLFRMLCEFILFSIVFSSLYYFINVQIIQCLILSSFISHTLNWVFNDNFWACIMFTFPSVLNPGEKLTIKYLSQFQKKLNKNKHIGGCMIYGSLSRNEWQIKSDLDIRILRKPGLLCGFLSYLFVFKERVNAVIKKQPLDIYLADDINFLRKMREDEFPVFLKNKDKRLYKEYKTRRTTDFSRVKNLNNIANSYENT
jgi:predicted nucleotidyltransferase